MVICFFIMFMLVYNSNLVLIGAREGLLLWYSNILPLLLPFMLISSYIVENAKGANTSISGRHNFKNSIITIVLGVFCGYPIGAKCTADFVRKNQLNISIGNLILPLCNNLSPMFLSGYVCNVILKNKISFAKLLFLIYMPYILYLIISLLIYNKFHKTLGNEKEGSKESEKFSEKKDNDQILSAIHQITTIGVYIMVCSIIIRLIISFSFIPPHIKPIIASAVEVSSGINHVAACTMLQRKKIALIVAAASFGGLSSILQTSCVIKNSGLSIFKYFCAKLLCGTVTYFLTMLLV